jgi:hypothetical protein
MREAHVYIGHLTRGGLGKPLRWREGLLNFLLLAYQFAAGNYFRTCEPLPSS